MRKATILKAVNGQFYFVLRKRGKIVATSETYTRKHSAIKTLDHDFPEWIWTDRSHLTPEEALVKHGFKLKTALLVIALLLGSLLTFAQVQVVTLDGSVSRDPDGSLVGYHWEQLGTLPSVCVITNSNQVIATVVPANSQQWKVGVYAFRLTVTDNQGATAMDTVQISVQPNPDQAPTANIGPDITVQMPATVQLDAHASDPDGSVAAYLWQPISGPNTPAFTPGGNSSNIANPVLSNLIAGVYKIRVKVTDNLGASFADTVQITVTSANQGPTSNAGPDRVIILPVNTVAIGGPDMPGNLAVSWSKVSGPTSFLILAPSAAATTVQNLVQGTYVFQKTVTALDGQQARDQVTVTVKKKCSWICQLFGCCK